MKKCLEIKRNPRNRLFYIEFLCYFRGSFGRADLIKRFNISGPAATNDISTYSDHNPGMLRYDPRQKTYLYDGAPPLFDHDVDDSLYALSGVGSGLPKPEERQQHAPAVTGSTIKRKTGHKLVATLTRAICQTQKVSAAYSSQSKGNAERELSPLAIVHDGLRWHVRCLDHESGEFKDYNLARFTKAAPIGPSAVTIRDDPDWETEVTVRLIPHPKAIHPETIQLDYDFSSTEKCVVLRRCFVGYFLRHWHIDFSENAVANPRSHQLFLENREELIKAGVSDQWALAWS